MKSKSVIVLFTLATVFAIGFTSIYFFGDYGWTVFVFLPFLIGFLPSYFASKRLELSKKDCYSLSFITLFVSLVLLLLCAAEGLLCIAMGTAHSNAYHLAKRFHRILYQQQKIKTK